MGLGVNRYRLTLNATDVRSAQTVNLQALQHIRLEAAEEHKLHQASSTSSSRSMLGLKKKTQTTHWHNEFLTAAPVTIAARDIALKAGNNIQTYGTQFNASRNLRLEAGDQIHYYAVRNQEIKDTTTHKKSSFVGIKYNSSTSTSTRSLTSALPTVLQSLNDILSNSGGNQLLQGTRAIYGGTAAFNAGVGERARADARIILEGIRTTTTQVRTQQSNYVVWQKQVNQGSVSETLTLPSFSGPAKPSFSAPGGLSVQIPQGDFTSQIQTLAQQPGMGYLNELTQRSDVNWQPVKLAFEQWDYRQEGLTPAGAALIGFAVAMATGGTGAGLLGTTGTVSTAAANAAFTSLAAQASITLINNKGDLGKTLKQLGSSQTVKNMLIAAGVAGVTSYTDNWGRTLLTDTGNTVVTDWAKRGQAYMLNTAAKGVLTGASSSSDWWTIAALGLAGEAYQYWVGRNPDARPGVDRDDPVAKFDEENGFFRVQREMVNGVMREGKNVGHNRILGCTSIVAICHGTPASNALNTLPGFNAFATLHDGWGEWLDKNGGNWNLATNLGSMPPALLVNYGALLDQYRYINARRK